MQKLIFFVLYLALTKSALADQSSWFPENIEILQKCFQEKQLPPDLDILILLQTVPIDYPKIHAVFLCKAKATNIYNEETGLDLDRLMHGYYQTQDVHKCRQQMVQNCFNKYNGVVSGGELIFNVIKCIFENEALNICGIKK